MAVIEAEKKGTWPGGSRRTKPFRKLADEMPNTIESMEDHGVKLVHQDEENAALHFGALPNPSPPSRSAQTRKNEGCARRLCLKVGGLKGGSIRKSDQEGELPWTILTPYSLKARKR